MALVAHTLQYISPTYAGKLEVFVSLGKSHGPSLKRRYPSCNRSWSVRTTGSYDVCQTALRIGMQTRIGRPCLWFKQGFLLQPTQTNKTSSLFHRKSHLRSCAVGDAMRNYKVRGTACCDLRLTDRASYSTSSHVMKGWTIGQNSICYDIGDQYEETKVLVMPCARNQLCVARDRCLVKYSGCRCCPAMLPGRKYGSLST